jgi:alkylated DNA repair dioxygenase AlkB
MPRQHALGLTRSHALPLEPGCVVELHEGFVEDHHALAVRLSETLPWVQEVYWHAGRSVPAPRLTSFHGDPGAAYGYSGMRYEPAPFSPELAVLRERVTTEVGCRFNCVLANLYRDGSDSVGYHADDEPELGPRREDIAIASLSLGETRRFVLKQRRSDERTELVLPGGSLLVMRGRTQQLYLHALPKTRRPAEARVNLTYRVVMPAGG